MRTTRRGFLALSGAASVAAALRLDAAPALAQAGPVKIGVLAAKAGVLAPVGESGLRGVQWATDRINATGGILGRKIELVIEEESSPKDTVERFRKLALQDKVDVISGAISTGVGLALGPVAEEMQDDLAGLGRHHPEGRRGVDAQAEVLVPLDRQRVRGGDGLDPHRAQLEGQVPHRRRDQPRLLLRARQLGGVSRHHEEVRHRGAGGERAVAQAGRHGFHGPRGRAAAGQAGSDLLLLLGGRHADLHEAGARGRAHPEHQARDDHRRRSPRVAQEGLHARGRAARLQLACTSSTPRPVRS